MTTRTERIAQQERESYDHASRLYVERVSYADTWWTLDNVRHAVMLNAGNDANGNPRRVWIGFDTDGDVCAVKDEGYDGAPSWSRTVPTLSIETTTAEYRRTIERIERIRGPFVVMKREDAANDPDDDDNVWRGYWSRQRAQRGIRRDYAWSDVVIVERPVRTWCTFRKGFYYDIIRGDA